MYKLSGDGWYRTYKTLLQLQQGLVQLSNIMSEYDLKKLEISKVG
jgi:hypothetical protein